MRKIKILKMKDLKKSMEIEILRIGQRVVRDDRVTTHVALVARAFGASKIYMNEINPEIKLTLKKINDTWGGGFVIEFIENWKDVIKMRKSEGVKIVHLTMYGGKISDIETKIEKEKNILVVVGAEKVPREIYEYADYNVAVGNQPHSEISSLAVFLDRIQNGKQFLKKFENAQRKIVPSKQGKKVVME
jgi:tRNA (cytidine56-2'-O)-methyltransferase